MDIFIICNSGLESVCAKDITFLIDKSSEKLNGICIVRDVLPSQIAILAYRLQSAFHIGILLSEDKTFKGLQNNFEENCDKKSWNELVQEGASFAVKTIKLISDEIPSPDLSAMFGETILNFTLTKSKKLKVNLKNPDLPLLVFMTDSFWGVGIDVIGFDLSRRPYKLFNHSSALNGVFAYTVARYVGVEKDSKVLDPFCNNGTIPIEIALFQNQKSPFVFERKFKGLQIKKLKDYFEETEKQLKSQEVSKKNVFAFDEQLKIMLSAKKNAKLAGILDGINFSKVSVDWLDTKFDEEELDFIISNPPKTSKRLNNFSKIKKLYDELFYQSKFILKNSGKLALVVLNEEDVKLIAEKHGFDLIDTKIVFTGQQKNFLMIYSKPKSS